MPVYTCSYKKVRFVENWSTARGLCTFSFFSITAIYFCSNWTTVHWNKLFNLISCKKNHLHYRQDWLTSFHTFTLIVSLQPLLRLHVKSIDISLQKKWPLLHIKFPATSAAIRPSHKHAPWAPMILRSPWLRPSQRKRSERPDKSLCNQSKKALHSNNTRLSLPPPKKTKPLWRFVPQRYYSGNQLRLDSSLLIYIVCHWSEFFPSQEPPLPGLPLVPGGPVPAIPALQAAPALLPVGPGPVGHDPAVHCRLHLLGGHQRPLRRRRPPHAHRPGLRPQSLCGLLVRLCWTRPLVVLYCSHCYRYFYLHTTTISPPCDSLISLALYLLLGNTIRCAQVTRKLHLACNLWNYTLAECLTKVDNRTC